MKYNALKIKNWCDENISSASWQRVAMKNLAFFKEKGFSISEINSPNENTLLDEESFDLVYASIVAMYEIELPYGEVVYK
jgi:hypothetical protein